MSVVLNHDAVAELDGHHPAIPTNSERQSGPGDTTRRDYRRAVIARANRETAEFLGQPKHFLRRAVYLSLVSVLIYLVFFGWEQATQTATGVILSAIVPNLAAVATVWMLQCWRAPYLIYTDAQRALSVAGQTIKGLEAEVNRKAQNQVLADELGRLDEWAVHNLWAKHPQSSSDPTFVTWQKKIARWKGRVVRLVARHNSSYLDVRSVRVLGNLASEPHYSLDPALNQQMRMLSVRRKRVDSLINKYRTD